MKRHQAGLQFLVPAVFLASAVTAVLACAHAAPDPDSDHEQAIRQLERRLTPGMSRGEIEHVLEEMGLEYLYVARDLARAMRPGTIEPTPISGAIQVTLPPDVRIFYKTIGTAMIDLDDAERMVSLRIQRGNAPR